MTENGTLFLAIEGSCRFWTQLGRFEPALTGILGDEQIARLIELFQLETWQGSVSATTGGAGTPNTWLIFGRVDPRPPCGPALPSTECSEPPWRTSAGIDHSMVLESLLVAIEELGSAGTQVSGDIRYLASPRHLRALVSCNSYLGASPAATRVTGSAPPVGRCAGRS